MGSYIFKLGFKDKPECNVCMLSRVKGLNLDGESVNGCAAIGNMPKCPDEGCRKDCPLVESKNRKSDVIKEGLLRAERDPWEFSMGG